MKDLFLAVLKYYALIGGVSAILAAFWIIILSAKADLILDRGNTVKVKDGPTFVPGCSRVRMSDYFVQCRAFGVAFVTFFMWPRMLCVLIFNPKWWCMVEEVKSAK